MPWEQVPGSESSEVRTRVRLPESSAEFTRPARTREVEVMPRRHWITGEDVREYGMTPNCTGCRNANAGGKAVKHTEECTEECRECMRKELEAREDPRLHREAERMLSHHEAEDVIEAPAVEGMEDLRDEVNEEMDDAGDSDHEMEVNDGDDLFSIMYEISATSDVKTQLKERGEKSRNPRRWDDENE